MDVDNKQAAPAMKKGANIVFKSNTLNKNGNKGAMKKAASGNGKKGVGAGNGSSSSSSSSA